MFPREPARRGLQFPAITHPVPAWLPFPPHVRPVCMSSREAGTEARHTDGRTDRLTYIHKYIRTYIHAYINPKYHNPKTQLAFQIRTCGEASQSCFVTESVRKHESDTIVQINCDPLGVSITPVTGVGLGAYITSY